MKLLNQDKTEEEPLRVGSGRVTNIKLPCPQDISPTRHINVDLQSEKLSWAFLCHFYKASLQTLDGWITDDTNPVLLWRSDWHHDAQSPNSIAGHSSMASPYFGTIWGPTMNIKDMPVTWETPNMRRSFPGTKETYYTSWPYWGFWLGRLTSIQVKSNTVIHGRHQILLLLLCCTGYTKKGERRWQNSEYIVQCSFWANSILWSLVVYNTGIYWVPTLW